MKKSILALAVLGAALTLPIFVSFPVQAEEMEAAADEATAPEYMEKQLEDGTYVHVKGDEVYVVDENGLEMPAPDGEHKLMDGTMLETKDGMMVHHDDADHEDADHEDEHHDDGEMMDEHMDDM